MTEMSVTAISIHLALLAVILARLSTAVDPTPGTCGNPVPECQPYQRLLAPLVLRRDAWLEAGGITPEAGKAMWDEATSRRAEGAFVTIADGEVHVYVNREGAQTRAYAALMLLYRAVARFGREALPDVEFGISRSDLPQPGPWMCFCGRRGQKPGTWLYPNFAYYSWPEILMPPWHAIRRKTAQVTAAVPFAARGNKMFWRGGSGRHVPTDVRKKLLLRMENRTDIADVARIPPFYELRKDRRGLTDLWDFCRHKYILYTEGNAYSGRMKYHLLCGSVLVSHPRAYDTMESILLEEGKHIVSTADNKWSDLEAIYRKLEAEPERTAAMAAENSRFMDLLTEDGVSCYLMELLKCYREAMKYNVSKPVGPERGVHLENFILHKMKSP